MHVSRASEVNTPPWNVANDRGARINSPALKGNNAYHLHNLPARRRSTHTAFFARDILRDIEYRKKFQFSAPADALDLTDANIIMYRASSIIRRIIQVFCRGEIQRETLEIARLFCYIRYARKCDTPSHRDRLSRCY